MSRNILDEESLVLLEESGWQVKPHDLPGPLLVHKTGSSVYGWHATNILLSHLHRAKVQSKNSDMLKRRY